MNLKKQKTGCETILGSEPVLGSCKGFCGQLKYI